MTVNQTNAKNNMQEDSIDIIGLVKTIWTDRMLVLKFICISFVIGVIVSLLSPIEFTSKTTFVTQTTENSGTNLSSYAELASLAGIKLNSESKSLDSYISPLLYTKISQSDEFSLSLFDSKLTTLDGDTFTVKEYLLKNQEFSKISKFIKGIFKNNKKGNTTSEKIFTKNYTFISGKDFSLIKAFKQKFSVELNERQGYINVIATDENVFISAQIVNLVTKKLQSRIISLRTDKIKEQLDYSEEQYKLKKVEFEDLQNNLAKFKDSNKNISTATFRSELQKLESEFQLQKNILMTLASEYNNNKIKLNKDTPIFSVLDDVSVPNQRSKPERKKIVLIFLALGFIFSIVYIFVKDYISIVIKKIINNK